jgi:hypothetical protein
MRPVRRAGPDIGAVADDVLVVHEVGDAGDAACRHVELVDRARVSLRRRRHRHRLPVVLVEREPDGDAAPGRILDRTCDQPLRFVREPEVVDRDVEASIRAREEVCERVRDLDRGLAALGERAKLDQPACDLMRAL